MPPPLGLCPVSLALAATTTTTTTTTTITVITTSRIRPRSVGKTLVLLLRLYQILETFEGRLYSILSWRCTVIVLAVIQLILALCNGTY